MASEGEPRCPFCGGQLELVGPDDELLYYMHCDDCEMNGPTMETPASAIELVRAARGTQRALGDVAEERRKQTEKWGVQTHAAPVWLAIIGEELGETCEAVLQARAALRPGCSPAERHGSMELVRKEAVQVAASAVSMIERIDAGLDLFEGRDAVAEAEQRTAERIAAMVRGEVERVKHTSHRDGLGMGDQRVERALLAQAEKIERGDWRGGDA